MIYETKNITRQPESDETGGYPGRIGLSGDRVT